MLLAVCFSMARPVCFSHLESDLVDLSSLLSLILFTSSQQIELYEKEKK